MIMSLISEKSANSETLVGVILKYSTGLRAH